MKFLGRLVMLQINAVTANLLNQYRDRILIVKYEGGKIKHREELITLSLGSRGSAELVRLMGR